MVTSFPTKLVMPAGISAPKLRMKFCITVTHRFLPFNRLSEAAFATPSIISGADLGNGGSGITGYEVWWNGGGEGPVTGLKVEISSGSTTTTQITGLSPGTYYGFAIKAVNIIGLGSLSSETSLIAATVPEKPAHLSLEAQSETEIKVAWESPVVTRVALPSLATSSNGLGRSIQIIDAGG